MVTQLITTGQTTEITTVLTDLAGQLATSSRRIYANDGRHFSQWLTERGLDLTTVDRTAIIAYRAHLNERYAKATANRMFVTARRLLDEGVKRGMLEINPAESVRGFKATGNETPHTALTRDQARELLKSIDQATHAGARDYALLSLLLRTGIRRAECAALTLGDFALQQGHHVLTIQHGKGDKRRVVKLPVDLMRAISNYLEKTGRKALREIDPGAPLFVRIRRYDVLTSEGITDKAIENIVKERAAAVGIDDLTPHGLRASFVTLALEGGASLHQTQYAAGHADPRTTERYQRRKLNLDDNAVDYIKL